MTLFVSLLNLVTLSEIDSVGRFSNEIKKKNIQIKWAGEIFFECADLAAAGRGTAFRGHAKRRREAEAVAFPQLIIFKE
jgi:hypothetical protein